MRPLSMFLLGTMAWLSTQMSLLAEDNASPSKTAPLASWIAAPDTNPQDYGVFHFRKVLHLASKPTRFVVHVSADNRYRLTVNGRTVSEGPQRSDLAHWRYETIDLAPYLHEGDNVLASLVWNWGPYAPVGQFSHRTGFALQADSTAEAAVSTGDSWKVLRNAGYEVQPVAPEAVGGYYASVPGECVKGGLYPWGWESAGYDDSAWSTPAKIDTWKPAGLDAYGSADGWQMTPRTLPPMEESELHFAALRRTEGVEAVLGQAIKVPPKSRAVLLFDQGNLANAFTILELSGGLGAQVRLTYAEALVDAAGNKGNRNEIDGRRILGVRDVVLPDGGEHRRYQTLWFHTYRYVQVEIETAEQGLCVEDLHGLSTGFPFKEKARFSCDQSWIGDMWRINWRVAKLCAWETYFDTPYYEQLQYLGDARIQALISYYVAGDDRLAREAIEHFDYSRGPDGLTASRYPSRQRQLIPPFSLLWVLMVHDHWMHRGDAAFVRARLQGVRAVLDRYTQAVDETGLVGRMPWWNFVDWTPQWATGVPPTDAAGHSTPITLMFVDALRRGAELESALGHPEDAPRLLALADRLCESVRHKAWDPARGLFADAPGGALYSQQTNALAILADAVPAAERQAVMERVLADRALVQASYYFGYYVREALLKAGLGDRYIEQLSPWRGMLSLGLTTTPETPEPSRSDSHAWSAHPNQGLLATVLGIRPAAPGFARVLIAPHLGPLSHAEGTLPHPRGEITVKLVRNGETLDAEITLPGGVEGDFDWKGTRHPLHPGTQHLRL